MKKSVMIIMETMFCLCSHAQNSLDLRGKSFEIEDIVCEDWNYPLSIDFKEDGTCIYYDARGGLECLMYIVGDDGKTLRLISSHDWVGRTKLTIVNLRVYGIGRMNHDEGIWLHVGDFSSVDTNDKYVEMKMKEAPSSVNSMSQSGSSNPNGRYNLQGIKSEGQKGLFIEGGKKKVAK